MGSDFNFFTKSVLTAHVSIRAPAWGATLYVIKQDARKAVSIRAPAWGATLNPISKILNILFQFALPHGERPPS